MAVIWIDLLRSLQVGGCAQAPGPAEAAREDLIRGNKEEGKRGLSVPLHTPHVSPRHTVLSFQLCFALSILGNPSVVLLDEPSTGMDPEGQQHMW